MKRVGIYFSLGGFFVRKDGKRFSLYLIAALILVSIASFMMLRSEADPYAAARSDVIYVSESGGADGKDGTSWNNAYAADNLQTAVNASAASSDQGVMVWVRRGNYARTGTLTLTKGAKVYGGFNGNETDIASRDVAAMMKNPLSSADATILSGDGSEISIVTGGIEAASTDTFLDGFTITGGKGSSVSNQYISGVFGGGMYNTHSSPKIENCTFIDNTAKFGGGMCNIRSDVSTSIRTSPTVINCVFDGNMAKSGGGMYSKGTAYPIITNCTFSNNQANETADTAEGGGGMCNNNASPTLDNCTFSDNTAQSNGGGMSNNGSCIVNATNCTFSGNTAQTKGAGIYNFIQGSHNYATITNCTFDSNDKMYNAMHQQPLPIVNSILWGGIENNTYNKSDINITLQNCVVKDGQDAGVTTADPLLGDLADNGGPVKTIAISAAGSAFRAGLTPNAPLSLTADGTVYNYFTPQTDARGVSFDAASADIGAYAYVPESVSLSAAPSSPAIGSTAAITGAVKLTGTASPDTKPGAVVNLAVSPNDIAVLSGNQLIAKKRGEVTLTGYAKAGNIKSPELKVTITPKPDPNDPLPPENQTDKDGTGSGVLIVSPDTYESFKVFDAFKVLSTGDKLPSGITIASLDAVPANSTHISVDCYIEGTGGKTSGDIIAGAIKDYWGITDTSQQKLRIVNAVSASAPAGSDETALAKFWRILVEKVRGLLGYASNTSTDSAYLPLQTNFTVTSTDIALLSYDIKTELNAANLLDNVNIFAVVKSGDQYAARSLNDAAGTERAKYISVSEDQYGNYKISTRIMLFNLPGTVSGDKTTGASWILPISSDKTSDDYFIVQDGNKDEEYAVAMALAAKTSNYATIRITVETTSGDTPVSYDTIISGDLGFREETASSDWTNAEMSGDVYTVTFAKVAGYSISVNGVSETYSAREKLAWGASWDVKATYSKIYVSGVSLDKTALVLAPGGSDKLTATVTPDDAYAKNVTWTTSDKNIAEIAVDGTVTAKAAGKAMITATANDGSGASAACAVTVRNNAGDDPTIPSLTPELIVHAIAHPSEIELADNTASYVTDAAKQTTVATAAGFKEEDTALTETGALAAGSTVVNGAVNDVIAKDPTVSKDIVYALPVVESKADKAGMLHAISFKVSGDIFGEVTGAEIRVLKVFPDGTGELFTPISAPEAIADKTAALYDTNEAMVTGAIDKEADYILTIFVKDGESFDLDGKADGTVIDPVSIIKAAAVEPDEPDNTRSHNGGCNTGAALPLLAAMAVLIIRKKR